MLKSEKTYILDKDNLKELFKNMFKEGANSHAKWEGQRDTCWSNVDLDCEECVTALLNQIEKDSETI